MDDMALKKKLMQMINRPESTSLEDIEVQPESIDDALAQKVESPDQEYELPEGIKSQVKDLASSKLAIPAIEKETEASIGLPKDQYKGDSDITAMLRKLKGGESLEDTEVVPETINDATAPMELRKAAMDKVKKKYLGQ